MSEAPRGEVLSSVLTSLLSPHRDIDRKRVSLLYRPHSPAVATCADNTSERPSGLVANRPANRSPAVTLDSSSFARVLMCV
jgi:hypothetical protein